MYIDEIFLKIIPTSHDSITSNGFLLEYKQESIVYITDTGYINHRNFIYLTNKTYYIYKVHSSVFIVFYVPIQFCNRNTCGRKCHHKNSHHIPAHKSIAIIKNTNTPANTICHDEKQNGFYNVPPFAMPDIVYVHFSSLNGPAGALFD